MKCTPVRFASDTVNLDVWAAMIDGHSGSVMVVCRSYRHIKSFPIWKFSLQCLFVRQPDPNNSYYSSGISCFSHATVLPTREFECANHTQLVHRDSRTLTAARKRAPKVADRAKSELV